MSLKMDDLNKMLAILKRLEKKGKKAPDAIDKMVGCFADMYPKDKSSVEIIRENREKMFKQ